MSEEAPASPFHSLSHTTFERNGKELLRFDGKLHGEFVDDFARIAAHNEIDGILNGNAALLAVEQLVFGDF